MKASSDRGTFLRRSLQLDGVASGLCGAILLAGAGPVSALIGLPSPGVARLIGALLLVYAAALLWNASRPVVSRGEVLLAVGLNTAWVVGSVIVIATGSLTLLGTWAVALIAAAVLGFAMLEVVGLRRLHAA